jgi:hypothetical protein
MTLKDNWRAILRHAWSIRFMLLAGLFAGLEVGLPLLDQVFDIPRGLFAVLAGFASFAGVVARCLTQKVLRE